MEVDTNEEPAGNEHERDSRPRYPDPTSIPHNPYPTIQGPLSPSHPSSSSLYGPFPGAKAPLPYTISSPTHRTRKSFSDTLHPSLVDDEQARYGVTDLRSPSDSQNVSGLEPAHLRPLNRAPVISRQSRLNRRDPGAGADSQHLHDSEGYRPIGNTGSRRSELLGQWREDLGGRAAQSAAWRAAVTYGGIYDDDENLDDERDSDYEALLDDVESTPLQGTEAPKRKTRRGRGGWRQVLKGTEHERIGLSAKPTRGRGSGRGRGSRARKYVDPGAEFKRHLAQANRAFLDTNLEKAADHARQAIQANPEVFQAHMLLAQILEKQGHVTDSIIAMKSAATCSRTPDVWIMTAEKVLDVAEGERTKAILKDAAECYNEVLKLHTFMKHNPDIEFEVRVQLVELFKEMNDMKYARHHCRHILKSHPEKTQFCREYAILAGKWQDTSDMKLARECYDRAFALCQDGEAFQDEEDDTEPFSHLNIYLELIELNGEAREGLARGKQLARWFLDRSNETFWDQYVEDDREFDEDNDRRNWVAEFQQGRASRDLTKYGQGLPVEIRIKFGMLRMKMGLQCHQEAIRHFRPLLQYADEIDDYSDLFVKVAKILRNSGFMKEAAEFYDPLRSMSNAEHPVHGLSEDTWMVMGTCYQSLGRPQDAIMSLENCAAHKGDKYTWACARLAKLHEDAGNTDRARFLCNQLITMNRRDLLYEAGVRMVPATNRTQSARMPAHMSNSGTAAVVPRPLAPLNDMSFDGVGIVPSGNISESGYNDHFMMEEPKKRKRSTKATEETFPGTEASEGEDGGRDEVKRPRLSKKNKPKLSAHREELYRHIQDAGLRARSNYHIVLDYWPVLHEASNQDAVEQWCEAANGMMEDFTSMKVFFPERDRNLKITTSDQPGKPYAKIGRHHQEPFSRPHDFLNISFAEWHHVFSDLALVYARNGEQDRCYRVTQDVLFAANVFFQDPDLHRASFGVALHCGLAFNDNQYLMDLSREIIKDSDFRNPMAFQLLAAVSRFSFGSNWFSSGPSQKFMLRMVKLTDFMAMGEKARNMVDWSAQRPSLESRAKKLEAEGVPSPQEPDAAVLTTYGHMVAVANHSHSALPYYFRALALQPENICVNLSIATMWIQNSMKRQTDNRQFGISQGFAFLRRYYDLRVASGMACHLQEAEFNVARMWHCLGLTHLAIPNYEKVLALSEAVQAEALADQEQPADATEDYAQEAAYALQSIYAVTGNDKAARKITERWLVI